MIVCPSELFTT